MTLIITEDNDVEINITAEEINTAIMQMIIKKYGTLIHDSIQHIDPMGRSVTVEGFVKDGTIQFWSQFNRVEQELLRAFG